jgi:hypothetical protein
VRHIPKTVSKLFESSSSFAAAFLHGGKEKPVVLEFIPLVIVAVVVVVVVVVAFSS